MVEITQSNPLSLQVRKQDLGRDTTCLRSPGWSVADPRENASLVLDAKTCCLHVLVTVQPLPAPRQVPAPLSSLGLPPL